LWCPIPGDGNHGFITPGIWITWIGDPFLNRSKSTYQISPLVKNKTGLVYPQSGTMEPVPVKEAKITGEILAELNTLNTSFPEMPVLDNSFG